jgi:hypothetical protein
MRYVLDFGSANAGTTPGFDVYQNADTLVAVSQPSIVEDSFGLFHFDEPWSATGVTSIEYKASVNGVELSGVIVSDVVPVTSGVATGGAASIPWLWTAGQVINTAAVEVGLTGVVDPYSSSDANFVRLRTLLKTAGHELMHARDWQVLVKECTITGDGTTTDFNVPADFLRMREDSGFDRSSSWPLGLLSSRGWQSLKATNTTSAVRLLYKMIQGRIQFYDAPALNAVVAFDYVSRYWAQSSGSSTADLYEPANTADTVVFEPNLIVKALKAKFLLATGQDASAAIEEYGTAFESAAGVEPARTLYLHGGNGEGERFLDVNNLPLTGYGP